LKYTPAKLREIRANTVTRYGRVPSDAVSVGVFFATLKEYRTTDPKFVACMTSFLVDQFSYLAKHAMVNVKKLVDHVAALLVSRLCSSDRKVQVCELLKAGLKANDSSIASDLAHMILNAVFARLGGASLVSWRRLHCLVQNRQLVRRENARRAPAVTALCVCQAMQIIQNDSSTISQYLSAHDKHSDWTALHIVQTIQSSRNWPTLISVRSTKRRNAADQLMKRLPVRPSHKSCRPRPARFGLTDRFCLVFSISRHCGSMDGLRANFRPLCRA
jgi:hypothetical protein